MPGGPFGAAWSAWNESADTLFHYRIDAGRSVDRTMERRWVLAALVFVEFDTRWDVKLTFTFASESD